MGKNISQTGVWVDVGVGVCGCVTAFLFGSLGSGFFVFVNLGCLFFPPLTESSH